MGISKATFGSGCFWCVEAMYKQLKGVVEVLPGYSGGNIANPTYEQVCSGSTGHAEVVQIFYDDELIDEYELLALEEVKKVNIFSRLLKSLNYLIWGDV